MGWEDVSTVRMMWNGVFEVYWTCKLRTMQHVHRMAFSGCYNIYHVQDILMYT